MSVRKSFEIYADDKTPGEDDSLVCVSVEDDSDGIVLSVGAEGDGDTIQAFDLSQEAAEALRDFLNEVLA